MLRYKTGTEFSRVETKLERGRLSLSVLLPLKCFQPARGGGNLSLMFFFFFLLFCKSTSPLFCGHPSDSRWWWQHHAAGGLTYRQGQRCGVLWRRWAELNTGVNRGRRLNSATCKTLESGATGQPLQTSNQSKEKRLDMQAYVMIYDLKS